MISVIVPAWNEEEAIEGVVAELKAELPDAEIVLVDDGSDDKTGEICAGMEAAHNVECVFLEKNCGKGEAFARGIKRSRGTEIVLFESDGQYDAGDVKRAVDALDTYDIVNGVRVERAEGGWRKWSSLLFTVVQKKVFGVNVMDVNSGLKSFRREVAETLFSEKMLRKWNKEKAYHRFVLAVAIKFGYSIGQVPISHRKRRGGKSYISPWKTPIFTFATFIRILIWKLS